MDQYFRLSALDDEIIGCFDYLPTEEFPEPRPEDVGDPFVKNPGERIQGWPEAPSATHRLHWTGQTHSWIQTASLAQLKQAKRDEITRQRIAADTDRFTYGGKEIKTADKDMFDMLIANARMSKGMPSNWPGGWKTMDNSYVPIATVAAWDAFFIAMYDAGIVNFQRSQFLKGKIETATTAAEVEAITWEITE